MRRASRSDNLLLPRLYEMGTHTFFNSIKNKCVCPLFFRPPGPRRDRDRAAGGKSARYLPRRIIRNSLLGRSGTTTISPLASGTTQKSAGPLNPDARVSISSAAALSRASVGQGTPTAATQKAKREAAPSP